MLKIFNIFARLIFSLILTTTGLVYSLPALSADSMATTDNYQQGLHCLRDKKFKDAASFFWMDISEAPDNYKSWYQLGLTYLIQRQWVKSIYCLKRVTQINPSFAGAYFNLGICYYWSTQMDLAEEQVGRLRLLGHNEQADELQEWLGRKAGS